MGSFASMLKPDEENIFGDFKSKARLSPSNAHFKQKGKLTIIKVVIGTITDMLKKIIFVVKSAWEIQIH